jgi:hypothetical protein
MDCKAKADQSYGYEILLAEGQSKNTSNDVFWEPGINNLADYPTKHHSGAHHRKVKDIYLYDEEKSPSTIQGCIKIMNSDKSPRRITTETANLAKARPAWKRSGTGRLVTWRDQQDTTKPQGRPAGLTFNRALLVDCRTAQFKLKKVWTERMNRNNNRRGAICANKGFRSLSMNNSFLTQ